MTLASCSAGMDARGSSRGISMLAKCAILLACVGCGGTTLQDLTHKQLEASSAPGVHDAQGNAVSAFSVGITYENNECLSLTSAHATVNGVALRSYPGGVTYYVEGQPGGCGFPFFLLPTGDTLPPGPDGRYLVLVSDSSMRLSAEFGDFLAPATAALHSPLERTAHPHDEVVVDFAPPPNVYNWQGAPQVRAGFMLDTTMLAEYDSVQLTGSSASFRLPTNVLGQGHLTTWWGVDVPTLSCGVEGCTGLSFREGDLGPFEIRN